MIWIYEVLNTKSTIFKLFLCFYREFAGNINSFNTTIPSSSDFLQPDRLMEWQVSVAPQLKGHPAIM